MLVRDRETEDLGGVRDDAGQSERESPTQDQSACGTPRRSRAVQAEVGPTAGPTLAWTPDRAPPRDPAGR
eukprot:13101133-Heterocapsa_arctica.AAC.1